MDYRSLKQLALYDAACEVAQGRYGVVFRGRAVITGAASDPMFGFTPPATAWLAKRGYWIVVSRRGRFRLPAEVPTAVLASIMVER